jgi:hypothetical protein
MSTSLYSVNFNGLTLDLPNGYTVQVQDGAAGVPTRVSKNVLTGQDGGVINAVLKGIRVLTLNGTIVAANPTEFFARRRSLINAFNSSAGRQVLTLTTWDNITYTIDAYCTGEPEIKDMVGNVTQIGFQVILECPDPLFNIAGSTVVEVASVITGTKGFTIPFPIPFPIGNQQTGSTITIDNTGDTDVVPSFRLDGFLDNPVATNLTTGESFALTTTVNTGRYVDLYVENGDQYVLLDGITPYYQFFTGGLFKIIRGVNIIKLSASGANNDGTLTVTYSDKRNGL